MAIWDAFKNEPTSIMELLDRLGLIAKRQTPKQYPEYPIQTMEDALGGMGGVPSPTALTPELLMGKSEGDPTSIFGPWADALNAPQQYNPWRTPPPQEQPAPTPPEKPAVKKPKPGTKPQYQAPTKGKIETTETEISPQAAQESPIPFTPPPFTQPYSRSGELQQLLESVPTSLEQVAGARPDIKALDQGPLRNILAALFMAPAGGVSAYYGKQQVEALDKWKENVDFKLKQQDKKDLLQSKIIEAKYAENQAQMENEAKEYLQMAERNSELAKSPGYIQGLYRFLPKSYVEKLLKDSIDPKTGNFKEGAVLYQSFERRMKMKMDEAKQVAQLLGIKDLKQAKMLAVNPDEFWKMYTQSFGSLEKRLTYLQGQTPTPENLKEIAQIRATMAEVQARTGSMPDYMQIAKSLDLIKQEREKELREVEKLVRSKTWTPEQGQERVNVINKKYQGYADITWKYGLGKTAGVAYGVEKQNIMEQTSPEYQLQAKYIDELNPSIGKADTGNTAVVVREMIIAMQRMPAGKSVPEYAKTTLTEYHMPYFIKIYDGIGKQLRGTYPPLMTEASARFGGFDKIPFNNLYQAAIISSQTPKNIPAIRAALMTGTQGAK